MVRLNSLQVRSANLRLMLALQVVCVIQIPGGGALNVRPTPHILAEVGLSYLDAVIQFFS
jgi:hypothetical protein